MTTFRHVVAFSLLTVCLAVVALWWRSYRVGDFMETGNQERRINFSSAVGGRLEAFEWYAPYPPEYPPFRFTSRRTSFTIFNWNKGIPLPYYRFTWKFTQLGAIIHVPHWFITLLTLLTAFAFRPSPRFRFNSRELLVAVTLAAMAFGLILGRMPRE